jgi:CelD/BcsL family acetyltransferase involved in cellulose biosynthesis
MSEVNLEIRRITPGELIARREEWTELLTRSDADPLFSSPDWLLTWWSLMAEPLGLEPVFLAARSGGRLVGLALFSRSRVLHRKIWPAWRLEMVGNGWRRGGVPITEHTGLILDRSGAPDIAAAFVAFLWASAPWDDLVVGLTEGGSLTERCFSEIAQGRGIYLRRNDPMEAWSIPLHDGFQGFLRSIGKGTRDRVMSGRRRLEALGHVTEEVAGSDTLDDLLPVLDRLHGERWGTPLLNTAPGKLFRTVARLQVEAGHPAVSVIALDGEPLSAMLNFRAGEREYNIQAGFRSAPGKRISMGWVHFGFAIERACSDGIQVFDLLAGEGKKTQFKSSLGSQRTELITLQFVRSRVLRLLYGSWDALGRTPIAGSPRDPAASTRP